MVVRGSVADIELTSAELAVEVAPRFGGSITRVTHRPSGWDVLWRTPWAGDAPEPERDRPLESAEWCACSRGGWQVAFPNGGDACDWAGVRHGFHGEASVAAWNVLELHRSSIRLGLQLTAAPLEVERLITVVGARVSLRDQVVNLSDSPVDVMWTQHPGLGGDLLAGPVTIQTNARSFELDDQAAVVGVDARPGAAGRWPVVGGADLSRPVEGGALLGRLHDFDGGPWVSVAREDGSLGVRLTWDAAIYPHCWIWQELGGTAGPPWHGEARVIGVEPATSWPGQGLARAATISGTALAIAPRATRVGEVTLSVETSQEGRQQP
jgi:hypothetical protein